jgi:hypothetical protein
VPLIVCFWLRAGSLSATIVALVLGIVGFLGGSLAAGGICCGEHAVSWGVFRATAGIASACLPIAARALVGEANALLMKVAEQSRPQVDTNAPGPYATHAPIPRSCGVGEASRRCRPGVRDHIGGQGVDAATFTVIAYEWFNTIYRNGVLVTPGCIRITGLINRGDGADHIDPQRRHVRVGMCAGVLCRCAAAHGERCAAWRASCRGSRWGRDPRHDRRKLREYCAGSGAIVKLLATRPGGVAWLIAEDIGVGWLKCALEKAERTLPPRR